MKKIISVCIILLLVSSTYGQELTKWEAGASIGGNIAWMCGSWGDDDQTKHKPIFRPAFSIEGAYIINPLIAVTMGMAIMKAGVLFKTSYEDEYEGDYSYNERLRFSTLRFNPMVRFMWGGGQLQYYALAGFYMSKILCGAYLYAEPDNDYEQSGKIKFQEWPDGYSGDDWYMSREYQRRIDLGLNIGGGVRYGIGPGFVAFNMLFGLGFLDFYKWPDGKRYGYEKPDGYKPFVHRNLAFMFGYVMLLGAAVN